MGCAQSTPEAQQKQRSRKDLAEGSNSAPGAVRLKIVERPGKDNFTDKPLDGGFKKSSSSSGDYSSDNKSFTASLSMRRRSKEERFETLGENKFVARAEGMTMGVLPILKAFQTFDKDKSGGLSVEELKEALEHLGIDCTMEFASQVLRQYDSYPDQVIDIKEFSTCVNEIKLILAFDKNGDGVIDADELGPLLEEIGVKLDRDQVQQIMDRFDVDRSGTIDLIELSSLVRTAQAFRKYDTDKSGSIDLEELKDALRKLGIRAGKLEAEALFRRYDQDGNGSLELHEFAVLVCDLQLYASFDTDADGSIDTEELMHALAKLGLSHPATKTVKAAKEVMEAWDMDCDGRLNISEFTRCVSDVSVFRDFDRDGDNSLSQAEFSAALVHLDIDTNPIDAFTKYADDDAGEGGTPAVTLSGFGRATNDLLTKNLSASFRHRRPLPLPPASEEKPRNRLRSSSGDFI